ncbi:MAG: hypothetical protein KGZ58_07110 [Ignavibacteriales bacterium]|nr:hypothetical protein [Ignavibacteriales bacterium]
MPQQIYEQSTERYFDTQTLHVIAVMQVVERKETRLMAISYDEFPHHIEIVTIHPIKRNQIINRVKAQRWIEQ